MLRDHLMIYFLESNQVLREAQQTITPCWNLPNPTLVCAIGAQGESACYVSYNLFCIM